MKHFSIPQDSSFPYVLVYSILGCSMLGAIISLASVWIVTAVPYAPAVVA